MTLIQIVDACLYMGIALFIVGFILRTIERRRAPVDPENQNDGSINIDRARGEKHSPANSRRVTNLLIAGVGFICLSAVLQMLFGDGPRAPEAAQEIEQLQTEKNKEKS